MEIRESLHGCEIPSTTVLKNRSSKMLDQSGSAKIGGKSTNPEGSREEETESPAIRGCSENTFNQTSNRMSTKTSFKKKEDC
jgi:hypothetical protein